MEYVAVGLIVGTHGLRGELKVRILTDDPDRFDDLSEIFVEGEGSSRELLGWRLHKGHILLLLENVPDRTAAEKLRGKSLNIPKELRKELPEGRFYWDDLPGLEVWDAVERLGVVREFDELSSASGLLRVRLDSGAWLELPFVEAWVETIDMDAGKVVVSPRWRQLLDPVKA